MADIDLKTATPDTTLPTNGFLFGADSQAASAPSVYSTQAIATTLLGSTSLTGATVTTSQPVLDLAQTWNAGGVTFTGLKFNAVATAAAAASKLFDFQVGGATKFEMQVGNTFIRATGFYYDTNLGFYVSDGVGGQYGNSIFKTTSNGRFAWSSTTNANTTEDLILTRRAAANLRLGAADVGATTATVTITIAAPGVVLWSNHILSTGTPVVFTTTGALPTGITSGTTYYAVVVTDNTFQIATSVANAIAATPTVITTSGSQSGTHTVTRYNITQRLSMQSVTGVTDRLGADLFIQGSQGTGTGAGGSIVFQVAPAVSTGTAQNALATALEITSAGVLKTKEISSLGAFYLQLSNALQNSGNFATGTSGALGANGGAFVLGSNKDLCWSDTANNPAVTVDLRLFRDAAATLALRNGTAAQRFNVYNTYTSSTNYEAFKIDWITTANTVLVGTEKGSVGGTARALEFQTDGTTRLTISYAGRATFAQAPLAPGWEVNSATGYGLYWTASTTFNNRADGVLTISNYAENDFGRLQFGGTTSSFPALRRSSTMLQAVLANDTNGTGFTNIQGKLTTDTAYQAGDPATTGYLVVYDSTNTAYKIPALAV